MDVFKGEDISDETAEEKHVTEARKSVQTKTLPLKDKRGLKLEKKEHMTTLFSTSEVLAIDWDQKSDNVIAFGSNHSYIRVWDIDRTLCQELRGTGTMKGATTDYPRVLDLACCPVDDVLVAAHATKYHDTIEGSKGRLVTWNITHGKEIQEFDIDSTISQVNSCCLNHNGNIVLMGGADGMVRMFDRATSNPIMGWPAHDGQVSHVAFSSGETTIVSTGLDGSVKEWSVHRIGKLMRSFNLNGSFKVWPVVRPQLALDGEGEHFLSSSANDSYNAYLYNVSRPDPIMPISGHAGPVTCVHWHPGGVGELSSPSGSSPNSPRMSNSVSRSIILTGSADHTARLSVLVPLTQLHTLALERASTDRGYSINSGSPGSGSGLLHESVR